MLSGYKYKSLAKSSPGGSKINTYLQKCILISFCILEYSFNLMYNFYSLDAGFFNTIRVSNSLDPD